MNKKIVSIVVVVALVAGGIGYYVGLMNSKNGKASDQANGFQNRGGGNRSGRGIGGFTGGQVIAKDATSLTIKARDGSSKIVFFTTATPVMKMVAGTDSDITVGQEVTVTGSANPDGSVNAESVQLRPAMAQSQTSSQAPKTN